MCRPQRRSSNISTKHPDWKVVGEGGGGGTWVCRRLRLAYATFVPIRRRREPPSIPLTPASDPSRLARASRLTPSSSPGSACDLVNFKVEPSHPPTCQDLEPFPSNDILEGPPGVFLDEKHGRIHNVGFARSATASPHFIDKDATELLDIRAHSLEMISKYPWISDNRFIWPHSIEGLSDPFPKSLPIWVGSPFFGRCPLEVGTTTVSRRSWASGHRLTSTRIDAASYCVSTLVDQLVWSPRSQHVGRRTTLHSWYRVIRRRRIPLQPARVGWCQFFLDE